jgi:hypothetical protein
VGDHELNWVTPEVTPRRRVAIRQPGALSEQLLPQGSDGVFALHEPPPVQHGGQVGGEVLERSVARHVHEVDSVDPPAAEVIER